MNIHILVSSEFCQLNYLESIQPQRERSAVYLCLNANCLKICDYLKQKGCTAFPVIPLSISDKESILIDYLDVIGRLALENKESSTWWATNISSKIRYNTPMPELLNNFVSCMNTIKRCELDKVDLCILGVSWPVIAAIEDYAQSKSIKVRINAGYGSRLRSKISGKIEAWASLAKGFIISFVNIMKAHSSFGATGKITNKDQPIYLIKSFVYPSSFLDEGSYSDPFFGDLVPYLQTNLDSRIQVVTMSEGIVDRRLCYQKMKDVNGQLVVPLESYLRLNDVLLAGITLILSLLKTNIKVPDNIPLQQFNFAPLLRELLDSGGWKIPFGQYLYRYAARRFARQHQLKACLMTYEGNPWERMFIMGLRAETPDLQIIGYQHSVVPQAAACDFISKWESEYIPHPDRVVTTGEKTADILKRYSSFSDKKIKLGCALRYQYLYDFELLPRRLSSERPFMVLVALEGQVEVVSLLSYAIRQARELPDINFKIRTHPVLTFKTLLKFMRMNESDLPENMIVSNVSKVTEDIKECDVVLYWGTTVTAEALMMGRPAIHFDRGDVLNYDPMFELTDFKWLVKDGKCMQDVLDQIQGLNESEYILLQEKGRDYIEQYLAKTDDARLTHFLPH
jgi:hypothetical protein